MTALVALLTAAALSATPMRTAETVPEGRVMVHFDGGLTLMNVNAPAIPFVPILTGDVEIAYGLLDGLDLRGRYTTHFGVVNRLGPELRARFAGGAQWAIGARAYTGFQLISSSDILVTRTGGELASLFGLLGTWRGSFGALTLEAGVTVEWVVFHDTEGPMVVDTRPYLHFVELALEYEWSTGPTSNLSLRLEVSIPSDDDDPWALLGFHPRLVFGGSLSP